MSLLEFRQAFSAESKKKKKKKKSQIYVLELNNGPEWLGVINAGARRITSKSETDFKISFQCS